MTQSKHDLHVYRRQINQQERSSLSVLASLVRPGSTVLDLGTGSGALGQYLSNELGCSVDGITYNQAEADVARPHYRRIEVADLERCELAALLEQARYDYVVCADVLEHLSRPERIVQACRDILAPGGQLLISVPNAGYSGLIAELIQGDFSYRDEGLLDRTHLRFFTRRSLARFLDELHWAIGSFDTIVRELPASEFKVAFDSLPPALSRYLLAIPDALSYQFIVAATPQQAGDTALAAALPSASAQALFSSQLYLGAHGQYAEADKLVASGQIGHEQQTVSFTLPAGPWSQLRLDPADRPGYLHLHRISLRDSAGQLCWQWSSATEGLAALEAAPQQQMLLRPLWPAAPSALVLLYGEDPWIELPIEPALLAQASAQGGAQLQVELGWPMSADYLAMAGTLTPLTERLDALEQRSTQAQQLQQRTVSDIYEKSQRSQFLAEQNMGLTSTVLSSMNALGAHTQSVLEQNRDLYQKELARLGAELEGLHQQHRQLWQKHRQLGQEHQQLQHSRDGLQQHLQFIENSTIFRVTRPLVHFKMWLTGQRPTPAGTASADKAADAEPEPAASATPRVPTPLPPTRHPVDIIVPVYRGLDDTRCCIESVLAHGPSCQHAFRLIAINDASPEPAVTEWLRAKAAQEPRLMLLENEHNLGFVGTVNRGMALSESNDVILLNSDAEVANDWLDRMVRAAWSDARVASVTPFSNNATICSYPHFCQDNALPDGYDTARLDLLFAQANAGQVVDVPTGVGFCMYIRRDALAEVGLFDVENFGKGYGEENDFCQRAARAGWRNLHLLDTFVRHAGGVSFLADKSPREQAAMQTLRRLHPGYEPEVHAFVAADPARSARQLVDLARLRESGTPVVLAVQHDRGGGTQRHVRELAEHLRQQAVFFTLTPAPGAKVLLEQLDGAQGLQASFSLPADFEALLQALRQLGVCHLHYHHLIGHQPLVLQLPERLGLPYDFTAHDFYSVCPQISLTGRNNRYCGEEGLAQCASCLRSSPAPGGLDITQWRELHGRFVSAARTVLAPSQDTARRLQAYLPQARVRCVPHTDLPDSAALPRPEPRPLAAQAPLKVVVLGALSPIKGADLLESVATLASQQASALELHLLGYAYRDLRQHPANCLKVHGGYAEADLPALLARLQPDLVWFPAQWPETYSYTLSACLQAGLPVLAPDLGAFPERLAGRPWSWLQPWASSSADWLARLLQIRAHFVRSEPPQPPIDPHGPAPSSVTGWSYQHDYLTNLRPASAQTASPAASSAPPVWQSHLLPANAPPAPSGARQQLLAALVYLRARPLLRPLAHAIPLRWQTRAKSWLRA